jgi:hypothetical protein
MADQKPQSIFGHICIIVLFGGMPAIGVHSFLYDSHQLWASE